MTDYRVELAEERARTRRQWAVAYVVHAISQDGERVRQSCEEVIRLGHVAAALEADLADRSEPVAFGRPFATGSDEQQRRGLVRERGRQRARLAKAARRILRGDHGEVMA